MEKIKLSNTNEDLPKIIDSAYKKDMRYFNTFLSFIIFQSILLLGQFTNAFSSIHKNNYWKTLLIFIPLLSMILYLKGNFIIYLWRRRKAYSFKQQLALGMGLSFLLPTSLFYLVMQLLSPVFLKASLTGDYQFMKYNTFINFILIWNLLIAMYIYYYKFLSFKHRTIYKAQLLVEKRNKRIEVEYKEYLKDYFIILVEKNKSFGLSITGTVEVIMLENSKLKELLDYIYIQLNRWAYVRVDSIMEIDQVNNQLFLYKEIEKVLASIPKDKGVFVYYYNRILNKNGSIVLSKTYVEKVLKKWKLYKLDKQS